jgi:hypothetical protein
MTLPLFQASVPPAALVSTIAVLAARGKGPPKSGMAFIGEFNLQLMELSPIEVTGWKYVILQLGKCPDQGLNFSIR